MKTGRQQFLDGAEAKARMRRRAARRVDVMAHLQSRHGITADSDPSLEQLEETHRQRHESGAGHDLEDLSV